MVNTNYVKDFILNYSKIISNEIKIESNLKTNIPLSFKSISSFGENLSALIFDAKGVGSRGLGYDLVDNQKKKFFEVKTCFSVSYSKCEFCGKKTPFFLVDCINCGNKVNFNNKNTTRWGINANSFLNQKSEMEKLILINIYSKKDDIDKFTNDLILRIDLYTIDPQNNYFVEYAKNQNENSNKSSQLNLLPESYDFFKSKPDKHFSCVLNLNWKDESKNKIIDFEYNENPKNLEFPFSLLSKNEKGLILKSDLFKKNNSYYFSYNSESFNMLKIRSKNLNKTRGKIKKYEY